jgi:hypothetical protein
MWDEGNRGEGLSLNPRRTKERKISYVIERVSMW